MDEQKNSDNEEFYDTHDYVELEASSDSDSYIDCDATNIKENDIKDSPFDQDREQDLQQSSFLEDKLTPDQVAGDYAQGQVEVQCQVEDQMNAHQNQGYPYQGAFAHSHPEAQSQVMDQSKAHQNEDDPNPGEYAQDQSEVIIQVKDQPKAHQNEDDPNPGEYAEGQPEVLIQVKDQSKAHQNEDDPNPGEYAEGQPEVPIRVKDQSKEHQNEDDPNPHQNEDDPNPHQNEDDPNPGEYAHSQPEVLIQVKDQFKVHQNEDDPNPGEYVHGQPGVPIQVKDQFKAHQNQGYPYPLEFGQGHNQFPKQSNQDQQGKQDETYYPSLQQSDASHVNQNQQVFSIPPYNYNVHQQYQYKAPHGPSPLASNPHSLKNPGQCYPGDSGLYPKQEFVPQGFVQSAEQQNFSFYYQDSFSPSTQFGQSSSDSHSSEEQQGSGIIQISGIGKASLSDIKNYFSDERRSGGGEIKDFNSRAEKNTVFITYHDKKVALRVVSRSTQKPHKVGKKKLQVELFDPSTAEENKTKPVNSIVVKGLGKDFTEEDFETVELYFENKNKSDGGNIADIKHDKKKNVIYITYEEDEVAQRVVSRSTLKPHKVGKRKLQVELFDPSTSDENETKPVNSIVIKGLGNDFTEEDFETVEMYFESKKKSGGGSIADMKHDKKKNVIYITYEEEEVAQRVVSRSTQKPHKVGKRKLQVELFDPSTAEENKTKPVNSIVVKGLGKDFTEEDFETVEMYFESKKKSGGGSIADIKHDKKKKVIYIIYEEEEVAERVVSRKLHTVGKRTLQVELFDTSTVQESETKPGNSIVVKWKGKDLTEQEVETVEMYFESKKKSGGENIVDFHHDKTKRAIFITYKEEEVAKRVVERNHKVLGKDLKVILAGDEEEDVPEEPDAPQTTVVIEGCAQSVSNDSVCLYFENRKKGGGVDIEKLERCNELMYITFKSEEDVKIVLKKSHTIEGNQLTLKLYQPPKMYKNKILLTKVPESTTREMMCNFLEAKVHYDLAEDDGLLYGEDSGVVLVSFEDQIDFETVSKNVTKKPFEKCFLEVRKVPISKSVIVKNLEGNITEDTLKLYFENSRRSGGSDVENVELLSEERCAIITFQDEQVLQNVLSKQHRLENHTVEVHVYYDCLGPCGGSLEPVCHKVPDPVTFDNIDTNKIKFLDVNHRSFQALYQDLKTCCAEAVVDTHKNQIEVKPTFTQDHPDFRNISSTWDKEMKSTFQRFIDTIEVQHVESSTNIWSNMVKHLDSEEFLSSESEIFKDERKFEIVIVGFSVGNLEKKIQKMCQELTTKFIKKLNEITENKPFKACLLKVLEDSGFVSTLREEFEDVLVQIDVSKEHVTMTGSKDDISNVTLRFFEEKEKIAHKTFTEFPGYEHELLQQPAACQQLYAKLHENLKDTPAAWEANESGVTIYSTSQSGVSRAHKCLEKLIIKCEKEVDVENVPVVTSTQFQEKVCEIKQTYSHRLNIAWKLEPPHVIVVGVSREVDEAWSKIALFIKENSIYTEKASLPENKKKFIVIHGQEQVKGIMTNLQHAHVTIICQEPNYSITIKATRDGLIAAQNALNVIANSINHQSRSIVDKPGIKTFLTKDVLSVVEKKTRCVIEWNEDDDSELEISMSPDNEMSCEIEGHFTLPGGTKLHVVHGDLVSLTTKLHIDVVIIEANKDLSPGSQEAAAVLNRAHLKYPSKDLLLEGDIHTSYPGDVHSKIIIYAAGPTQDSSRDPKQVFLKAIKSSLEKAMESNYSTLAIATFKGKGVKTHMTIEESTQALVAAIHECFEEGAYSRIKSVYLTEMESSLVNVLITICTDVCGEFVQQDVSENAESRPSRRQGIKMRAKEQANATPRTELTPMYTGNQNSDPVKTLEVKNLSRILITETDLGKEEADVLVNSSNTSLNLDNGAVSKSLVKHGGPSLQKECKEKYPKGINMGAIAVTDPGKLPSVKKVFHICLPDFNKDGEKVLRNTMQKLLKMTVDAGFSTIAIPALGTGNLGYPRDLVAKLMYEIVINFIENSPSDSLRDIKFVLHPSDEKTIQVFMTEAQKHVKEVPVAVQVPEEEPQISIVASHKEEPSKGLFKKMLNLAGELFESKPKSSESEKARQNKPPPGVVKTSSSSSVTLFIYSDNNRHIDKAVDLICTRYDQKQKTKTIEDDCIKEWDDEMLQNIYNISLVYEVAIHITQDLGKITILGLKRAVLEAATEVNKKIREIENLKKERENAENLAKVLQWSSVFIDENGSQALEKYSPDLNFKIEKAYKAGESTYVYVDNGVRNVIDFKTWQDYLEDDPDDKMTVIRKTLKQAGNITLPVEWTAMENDMETVQVMANSQEYIDIDTQFTNNIGSETCKIIRIDRVQNKTLYEQYKLRLQTTDKAKPNNQNLKPLWHGTQKEMQSSITTYGFNRSFCNQTTNEMGEGVYFTKTSALAVSKYCKEENKQKYLFLSKVVTGEFTKVNPVSGSQKPIRVPPSIDPAKPEVLYDSVVDDMTDPQTFVIFNDTQAYPEYLIVVQC